MNQTGFASQPDDPPVLDCLVDNELNETERRALIASLETRPDGWRSCALAFLEDQSLQADLGVLIGPPGANASPRNRASRRRRRPGACRASRWASGVTLAASLVAAFALGRWYPHTPADKRLPSAGHVAGSETPPSEADETPPDRRETPQAEPTTKQRARPDRDDFLRLVVNNVEAGDTHVVDVPLLDAESVIPRSEWDRQLPVPREIWKYWEEMGLAVTRKRRLAPLQLDDGRRVVFPVDEFEFTPVAHRMY